MHIRWGRFALYFALCCVVLGVGHWGLVQFGVPSIERLAFLSAALIVFVVAAPFGIVRSGSERNATATSVEASREPSAAPYRGGPHGAQQRPRPPILPRVSGKATAIGLLVAFSLTALAFPFAMHQARWVEVEVVFAVWWFLLAALLTALLFRGARVDDDHAAPWNDGSDTKGAEIRDRSRFGFLDVFDLPSLPSGADAAEGCFGAIAGIVFALVAVVAAWLLVEFIVPAVFFVAYVLFVRAIARVANDRHSCAGHFGRALLWGAVWSAAYVGPLALLVALIHAILRARTGVSGG